MTYRIPLAQLDAKFITLPSDPQQKGWHVEDSRELIAEWQGIRFTCPCHYVANGNSDIGVHKTVCWFRNRGVPDDLDPGPSRWTPSGTSIDDLTFVPGTPAVAISVQADCHFWIRNGHATDIAP